ncbi:MAG: hypothetical protein K0Q85_1431 [Caproiciproducens sp.]|nr:hypothetical protein [Caproiciproducens sp.]
MAISMRTRKLFLNIMIVSFVFIIMAGCSNKVTPPDASSNAVSTLPSSSDITSEAPSAVSSAAPSAVSSAAPEDSAKTLLTQIMESAKKGRIIDCEFPVKTSVIDDVTKKWGEADKTEYIASAKGNYATFSKHKAAFGFNKGAQIFEARTFDSKLGAITLSKAKEVFGKPAYTNTSKTEDIIGYTAGKEFKILLVFPKADGKTDAVLNHYSVFYPDGTVNTMADDPGRQW